MKIFVEGLPYKKTDIENCFGDLRFSSYISGNYYMNYVGYYFNSQAGSLNYILPKVLMRKGLLFGELECDKPTEISKNSPLHHDIISLINKFLPFFQSSLFRYKSEVNKLQNHSNSNITENSEIQNSLYSKGNSEISILEIIYKISLFSKKNKALKHYILEYKTKSKYKRTNWSKTVSKVTPAYISGNKPFYFDSINRVKVEDSEYELLKIYVGIVNYISSFYFYASLNKLSINAVPEYWVENKAGLLLSRIKRIRKVIFNDVFREMSFLCEMFLTIISQNESKGTLKDVVLVRNYNLVFEKMIDNVFAVNEANNKEIEHLKNNKDGKIIDHIFGHKSLTGEQSVFYIGDSKYYKEENKVGKNAIYKQFTYAKNIIQFNIDFFNKNDSLFLNDYWYRDELTEGYNPTPNFFIRGSYSDEKDFNNLNLLQVGECEQQFHFKYRFFDRDSLRVLNYSCSFLNILKIYAIRSSSRTKKIGMEMSTRIRKDFVEFLNNDNEFFFYHKEMDINKIIELVNSNFKLLNGKMLSVKTRLIIAKHKSDTELDDFLNKNSFEIYLFK
jgi:hypothetical protein